MTRSKFQQTSESLTKQKDSLGVLLCASALAIVLTSLIAILVVICFQGLMGFWPKPLLQFSLRDGTHIWGELVTSTQKPNEEKQINIKQGNRELLSADYIWIKDSDLFEITTPTDLLLVERYEWGNFYGKLKSEDADSMVFEHSMGATTTIARSAIHEIIPVNTLSFFAKICLHGKRFFRFLSEEPREANTEGGIFQALIGTVLMVIVMTIFVTPVGVVTALYLREYAKPGLVVSMIRTVVNNLAGVPSIVFGVFGLGFFVYRLGYTIDQLFFYETLPTPTFGTGGILWASLTLALLTLPNVIVATEEGLANLPRNLREASFALGATKAETVIRVILPSIAPYMLTGVILAISRAAGEVAPLMVTGVVKLAPALPLDSTSPFLHLDRKFMHLGFHIYDLALQSPNAEAVKPAVYATTMILLLIVLVANLGAVWLRARLRRNLGSQGF